MDGTRGKGSLKRNTCARIFWGVSACSKGKIAADPFSQDEESLKEAETSENNG